MNPNLMLVLLCTLKNEPACAISHRSRSILGYRRNPNDRLLDLACVAVSRDGLLYSILETNKYTTAVSQPSFPFLLLSGMTLNEYCLILVKTRTIQSLLCWSLGTKSLFPLSNLDIHRINSLALIYSCSCAFVTVVIQDSSRVNFGFQFAFHAFTRMAFCMRIPTVLTATRI